MIYLAVNCLFPLKKFLHWLLQVGKTPSNAVPSVFLRADPSQVSWKAERPVSPRMASGSLQA